jgi:uncharacterized Zn finger protein
LGRELIEGGMRQVEESHDEGETGTALGECLPVVFQAVNRSSLSRPERLLFAIDAELADDYDLVDEASAVVFDAPSEPEDWSTVADRLLERLKARLVRDARGAGEFSRDYRRDGLTNWLATALREAGRENELQSLYESEARATGSYERLVKFLVEQGRLEDAERWAREGIAATGPIYAGIAANLAASLCEMAGKRKQWDVVAAHAAYKFFERPSPSTFDELIKAARKAKVEEPVRAAALRFLETGVMPYQVISPRPADKPTGRITPSARRRAASPAKARPTRGPAPEPPAPPVRVKTDPAWPLPVPDSLTPLLERRGQFDSTPRPHLEVLLEMAIAAKRPDEVLRWYGKMAAGRPKAGPYYGGSFGYADRVAEAVAKSHPERAIAIYRDALNALLPQAQLSAYESAAAYLRKLRPIYEDTGRAGEWKALIASIRQTYGNRPRFMDILDGVEGRPIVQATRPRRR